MIAHSKTSLSEKEKREKRKEKKNYTQMLCIIPAFKLGMRMQVEMQCFTIIYNYRLSFVIATTPTRCSC